MADAFTTRVRAEKPEVGANDATWGTELNANTFDMFDEAIAGVVEVSVTASNVTLTANNGTADQARNPVILLTGTPGTTRTVAFPDVEGWHWVVNNSDSAATLSAGAGSTVSALAGFTVCVYSDGLTNMVALFNGVMAVGGQIKFPSTQNASSDANTLDDYKEGTFTPTFTANSAPSGVTYSTQVGKYTKVGNRFDFKLRITLTSKGTGGSGAVFLSNLPFTSATDSLGAACAMGSYDHINLSSGYTQVTVGSAIGANHLTLNECGDNVAAAALQWSAIADNSDFSVSGTIFV